ncbi:hypothetical protein [Sporomusa ovata]|uniref:hypothetical protein n=1 Tax=Sporomusa ovata TaxID=2378 RepID=UPI0030D2B30E
MPPRPARTMTALPPAAAILPTRCPTLASPCRPAQPVSAIQLTAKTPATTAPPAAP